ncbi:anti-sigma factor domain-containing protein [Paenibacillus humicola]|uniref:anti-sigma factor n=1 Tax=Paenibacillus humicola TaxID=3110540 RepID=UPI00237B9121|nr:anti-sigma factor [Paenibacillus humicola]
MQKKVQPECSLCLDVISGICTDEERLAFERHLPGCEACRAEMEELRVVWEALHANMERIEPPADLKRQVMDAVLAEDESLAVQAEQKIRRSARLRKRLMSVSALLLVLLIAGTVWNVRLYRERTKAPIPIEQALSASAAQIKELVPLKPQAEAESRAYGVACIVDNGHNKQFIVYVFGAAATSGSQAYQVWLVKDGQRESAGTFRVKADDRGIGVLAMPIASDRLAFDRIGITLEPDDKGSSPRGERMFASS